jgi:hypothetical protein
MKCYQPYRHIRSEDIGCICKSLLQWKTSPGGSTDTDRTYLLLAHFQDFPAQ